MRAVKFLSTAALAYAAGDASIDALWVEFKAKFHRESSYASAEEEQKRKLIFENNMRLALELDEKDNNAVPYGHLSPFADWTAAEFAERNKFFGNRAVIEKHKKSLRSKAQLPGAETDDDSHYIDHLPGQKNLPKGFDWREKKAVNEVKNQGQCGSCWSFSTIANVETAAVAEKVKGGELFDLSEQQLVDCDKSDNGCEGGLPEQADKWLIAHHSGLEFEKDYPYTGKGGQMCAEDGKRERIFVGNFVQISQDEATIAAAVMQYGALSIGINANAMQLYMGGVAQPTTDACDPEMLNHGVALVGFGSEMAPANGQAVKAVLRSAYSLKSQQLVKKLPKVSFEGDEDVETPFWVIRNSWGAEWGEEGYYRLIRGVGACGMNQMVSSATDIKYHDGKPDEIKTPPAQDEMYV